LGITDTTGDVWDRVVSVFTVNNVRTPFALVKESHNANRRAS
jgi:hypothetical protein